MQIVDLLRQTTLGAVVTLVLLCVLTQKELLQAHGGCRALRVARATTIVSAPILALFIAVVAVRLLSLLRII
jgi:hypothetical protein